MLASEIFSRMMRQASNTEVEGSNFIVFVTSLSTMLIFSESVAILTDFRAPGP